MPFRRWRRRRSSIAGRSARNHSERSRRQIWRGGGLWPTIVTAIAARSLPKLSVVIAKDLTSGSCELVTGLKSIGPTSPFGVCASALSHNVASDCERYLARRWINQNAAMGIPGISHWCYDSVSQHASRFGTHHGQRKRPQRQEEAEVQELRRQGAAEEGRQSRKMPALWRDRGALNTVAS